MPESSSPARRRGPNGRFQPSSEDSPESARRRNLTSWQQILERHQQRFPGSGFSCLIELLLKLCGFPGPQLQGLEPAEPSGTAAWLAQLAPAFPIATLPEDCEPHAFVREQVKAGRPVALWYPEPIRRGWVVVDLIDIPPHCFAELWSKAPESGAGEGRYSERRGATLAALLNEGSPWIIHVQETGPLAPQLTRRPLPSSSRCDLMPSS